MTKQGNEKLIGTLERKLQLVKDYRHTNQYFSAAMDYHFFIDSSDKLKPILQDLIAEEKISPVYLEQLFNDIVLHAALTQVDVKNKKIEATYPLFYTREVEEKYGLMRKFVELLQQDYEEFKKHPDQLVFDPNAPIVKAKRDDEFFYVQKLHNDILEKLNEEPETQKPVITQRLPYWKEQYLYLVYKILKANERMSKTALSVNDLQGANWSPHFTYMFLGTLCKEANIELPNLTFHKSIYLKYDTKEEYERAQNIIKSKPETHQAVALKKVLDNEFGIEDLDPLFFGHFPGILEFIEFDTKLSKTSLSNLRTYFNDYLDLFLQNRLVAEHQNYVTASVMKAEFLGYLRRPQMKYGNSFLLWDKDVHLLLTSDKEFLFLHALVTLEYLQFLYVEDIWVFDMDLPPEEQTENYKARLHLLPKFFESEEPKPTKIEPQETTHQLRFDSDKAIFFVDDKAIKLTKFSNQYHCLRIMFENPTELNKEWFFSEIAEKLDRFSKSTDKVFYNYISQLKVKAAVQGVDDLFITTKQSVKINPKYLPK